MGDSSGNIYFSSGSSRIPRSRQPSNSHEHNILPHLLAPLPCESQFHSYLGAGENAQNISVQFMHSCPSQDITQLDSDILQPRLTFDDETNAMVSHPTSYPESSQRTTSHALSPYADDASGFHDFSSCDLPAHHVGDAPLHGTQSYRRGSWPSHWSMGYSPLMQSPPRTARSPASEPPENTSDESYQDSDVEEVTRMSPMLNQFQIHSSRHVDPSPESPHHMYRTQALQPSVMTFQLSETMLQPVDDPENRHILRGLLDMNIVADDGPEVLRPSPSSTFSSPSTVRFGGAGIQGLGTRLQHDGEKVIKTNQFRVPVPSPNSVSFPSPHSPAKARVGDQRPSGSKQQKKSKMHQCEQCKKMFPRPSGLATHMNSHSGAKPYKCIVPNCEKSFAVRSNAKRHLRTHGINPSSDVLSTPRFAVGFEEPFVTQVHDAGKQPSRYRWITHNPSPHESEWHRQGSSSSAAAIDGGSHTGLTFQTSMSSTTSSTLSNGSDDDYDEAGSSSVADAPQYQNDFGGGTDDFSGSYPSYGEQPRRG